MKAAKHSVATKYAADFTLNIEKCAVRKTKVAIYLEVKDSGIYRLLRNIRIKRDGSEVVTVNVLNSASLTVGYFRSCGTTIKGGLLFVLSRLLEISAEGKMLGQKVDKVPLVYLEVLEQ